MKIRYKSEINSGEENFGLIILEKEPEIRTLNIVSQLRSSMRVPLPYIYFAIRYKIEGFNYNVTTNRYDESEFVYEGLSGGGLSVFCSKEPLKSFHSFPCFLPTDYYSDQYYRGKNTGVVCTNHDYDYKHYKKLSDLVNEIIGLWYSSIHKISYSPIPSSANKSWGACKLEDLQIANWAKSEKSLFEILRKPYSNYPIFEDGQYGEEQVNFLPRIEHVLE